MIAAWTTRQIRENKRLRKRLGCALEECQRFCRLEDEYCYNVSEGELASLIGKTPLAIKRLVRLRTRARNVETPTITPLEIARELGRM